MERLIRLFNFIDHVPEVRDDLLALAWLAVMYIRTHRRA